MYILYQYSLHILQECIINNHIIKTRKTIFKRNKHRTVHISRGFLEKLLGKDNSNSVVWTG